LLGGLISYILDVLQTATALKPEDAFDTNRVKFIGNNQGYAIYFSRGLVHLRSEILNIYFNSFGDLVLTYNS
jgi:CMP-2-keto-3-deoxyoctulosonic acid synthetase